MDLGVWLSFFAAAWLISISPGPATLFALSSGMNHGLRRALLPPFIDATRPLLPQYLAIAFAFTITEFVVMTGYTGLAAQAVQWLRSPRQIRLLNRFCGGAFVLAAVALASYRGALK